MSGSRRLWAAMGAVLVLATAGAPRAEAQFLKRVKDRVKQRVTERIERKAGEAADSAVDRAIGAAGKAVRDSSRAPAGDAGARAAAPSGAEADAAAVTADGASSPAAADSAPDVQYPSGPDDVCTALPATAMAALLRDAGVAGKVGRPLGGETTCMYPIETGTGTGASVSVAYVPASSAAAAIQGHSDDIARLSHKPRHVDGVGDDATIDADQVGVMLAYRVGAMRGFIQVLAPDATPAAREQAAIAIAKAWIPRLSQ